MNRYSGEERREKQRWHFEKTLSVGHLITTISIAGSVMTWGINMDKRVAVLEKIIEQQTEVDRRQDFHSKEALDATRTDLRDINQKLDRLIERQNSN